MSDRHHRRWDGEQRYTWLPEKLLGHEFMKNIRYELSGKNHSDNTHWIVSRGLTTALDLSTYYIF